MANWTQVQAGEWTISKPNDPQAYCKIKLEIDEDSITPSNAKIRFNIASCQSQFEVPVHVLFNYSANSDFSVTTNCFVHLKDSGILAETYTHSEAQYTLESQAWSSKQYYLSLSKNPFDDTWQVPAMVFCIDKAVKSTANAVSAAYELAKTQKIIDCTTVTTRNALHKHIAKVLDFPDYYGENLGSLMDCLRDIEGTTPIYIKGWKDTGFTSSDFWDTFNAAAAENTDLLITYEEADTWPAIDSFILSLPFDISARDAVAASITGTPTVAFTDNGDNTYSFYFSQRAQAGGSPTNKKTYNPINFEAITYQVWEKGKAVEDKTITYRHTPESQPSGSTEVIGPITWNGADYDQAGTAVSIKYVAYSVYDATYENPIRSNTSHLVINYTAPPNPKVENSFCYFNTSRPRATGALYFTWQVPDDTRTTIVAPVVGYRVGVYIKKPGESEYTRFKNLVCSCSTSDFSNLTDGWAVVRYRISYLDQNDPLPTATMPNQKYFRANSEGFVYTDEGTINTGYEQWNQPLPSRYAGTRFESDAKDTTISVDFLNEYYLKESDEEATRTWRGITLDLSTFPEDQRLPVGTSVLLRVTAFSKNGKGTRLYSQWSENTQSAPLPSVVLEESSAVLNVYQDGSWQEGLVHVYDGSNWVEAEGLFVYDGEQWVEAIV